MASNVPLAVKKDILDNEAEFQAQLKKINEAVGSTWILEAPDYGYIHEHILDSEKKLRPAY